MRTQKAEGPQEPNNRRKKKTPPARPRRTASNGPTAFGNVMRDVRGGGTPKGQPETGAPMRPGAQTPGMAGFDPAFATAAQLDPGAVAARSMGAVATVTQLANEDSFGVQDATEALRSQDKSVTFQAQAQVLAPTPIARMTPAALLETVLDESTRLAIDEASKELHVELEPADLGPVVVRLRKGPDGTLDIQFRARQGDAARMLESGSELLRERLATAGFAQVAIDVSHDSSLVLTGGNTTSRPPH